MKGWRRELAKWALAALLLAGALLVNETRVVLWRCPCPGSCDGGPVCRGYCEPFCIWGIGRKGCGRRCGSF